MKNVIVAGVSGTTGRLVAQNLCDAGFSPIALVRDPGKADDIGASAVRRGDLENLDPSVFDGIDGAVFAAGSGSSTGPEKTISVDQEGSKTFTDLAKEAQVGRVVMLSAKGAEASDDDIRHYMRAKRQADDHLQASGVNYTIVRPVKLSNNSASGRVELAADVAFDGEVPRADVAQVLVVALTDDAASNKVVELRSGETPIGEAFRQAQV